MGHKILLVDDSPYIAFVVTALLNDSYEVEVAHNTEQMYAKFANQQFDLTLLDLDLQDGVRIIKILPEIKRRCDKVIVFSATTQQKDFDACMAAAINGFLVKSGEIAELKQAVEVVIAGHQMYPQQKLTAYCNNAPRPMPLLHGSQHAVLDQLFATPTPRNAEIAEATGLSNGHVANIFTSLFKLFGVRSRVALLEEARSRGYEARH